MKSSHTQKLTPEKQLGMRIREIRRWKNLTQHELAIHAGFSTQHIGDIERGDANPTLSCLATLAMALGVEISQFFSGSADATIDDECRKKELLNFIKRADSDNLHILHSVLTGLR